MRAHPLRLTLTAALVLTSCGRAAIAAAPSTTAATRAPQVAPMARETALPAHPPVVDLTLGSRKTQRGVRYATDFRIHGATTTQAPRWPVPWPPPITGQAGAALLVIHSTALPDDVIVKSWTGVIPDGHREPDTHSAAPIYECHRFTAPSCKFTRHSTDMRLTLPARAVAGPFIAIYMQWHIPSAQQLAGAMASEDATATWLFRS